MSIAYGGDQITFPDASTQNTGATGFGFKNRIINGALSLDQRNNGAAQTITAAAALAYTVDRWYAYCTGANVTGQQIAGTYASSQNRYQFTGAASVTAIGFGQRIEAKNSYDLANSTATLSCYIANSLLTTVTWTAYYATTTADTFGSLASPTVTSIATGTFTVTSTRAQYTANISIPSAATTGIQIVFTVGAQTSGTWVVDTVQLEKGSTTTTFDVKPIGTELALCQRYYYKMLGTASGRASFLSGVVSTATTAIQCGNSYPVVMRSVPTVSYSGLAVSDANIAATITSITNNNSSTTNATLNVTASGGGLTAGRPGLIVSSGNATDYLDFSAEL